ncbi:hypothetical protein [[Kitasatospora] papulosa]|uniref:hypothetical protein n=1 Tax=[Kitasatospora] papulosa TaxID=1464011 RepID=UPI0036B1FBD0
MADLKHYGTDHHVDVRAVELDVTSEDSADAASMMGNPGKRLAALLPSGAEVTEVAKARRVPGADGTRPERTHIDPSRYGSEAVSAVADRVRADFLHRTGQPAHRRQLPVSPH